MMGPHRRLEAGSRCILLCLLGLCCSCPALTRAVLSCVMCCLKGVYTTSGCALQGDEETSQRGILSHVCVRAHKRFFLL